MATMTTSDIDEQHDAGDPPPAPHPTTDRRRPLRLVLAGVALAAVLLVAAAIGVSRSRSDGQDITTEADGEVIAASEVAESSNPNPADLDELIESLQTRLERIPNDDTAWATLGLAYVQQAKATVNPSFYELADGALAESLAVDTDGNFLARAGLSALASARHDFAEAKEQAELGLEINEFSAILHGALSDAELQLGNYDAAFDAVDRMTELRPDTTSFARASYVYELRGDIDLATRLMEDALEAAPTPADRAFALFQLGELSFNQGDPNTALTLYNQARQESPDDPAALAGKARAEAALGQTETALDHYAELVAVAPEPSYLVQYGELLESLGRTEEAEAQYAVFQATQALFEENGVLPDAAPTLFLAEHDDPQRALAAAEAGLEARPFLAMYDAYAWALHQNGRDEDALVAIDEALSLGYRNASYLYHSGMIKLALGDDDGARTDLQEALDLNPYFDPLAAPIARRTLDELGGSAASGTGD